MVKKNKGLIEKKFNTIFLTVVILSFILGFYSGWNFSDDSLTDFQVKLSQTQLNIDSLSLRYDFLNNFNYENFCDEELFDGISTDLYNIGQELIMMENNNKVDTLYYKYLKERYNINQVFFYINYRKFYYQCNDSKNIMLFFFDNKNVELSKKQGEILNSIAKLEPNVKIIAMDYNYSEKLDYFYNNYDVQEFPFIVMNYNRTFNGLTKKEELLKYMN